MQLPDTLLCTPTLSGTPRGVSARRTCACSRNCVNSCTFTVFAFSAAPVCSGGVSSDAYAAKTCGRREADTDVREFRMLF